VVCGLRHASAVLLGNNPVAIGQEADWAPGPVCKGFENLVPTGVRSTDRPARSESDFKKYLY
jgi:hypothetical protein